MENKSQVSLEYIIMLSLVLIIGTIVVVLSTRILTLEESLRGTITEFRNRFLGSTT
ncbi:MAG: class III signal peptide-containing protein [archaeon]